MQQMDMFEPDEDEIQNPLSTRDIYCPMDGLQLTESEWEWCGFRLLTCPNGHVWEVQTRHWGKYKPGYFEFDLEEMTTCSCGRKLPARLMKYVNYGDQPSAPPAKIPETREYKPWPKPTKTRPPKVCPNCLAKIQEAWMPDPNLSHARLEIWPVRLKDKVVFAWDEEVKIEPYPNPYGCGGLYGGFGSYVKSEAEVEKLIASLKGGWQDWIENKGLRVEIIRHEEMTEPEYWNAKKREEMRQQLEKDPDAVKKDPELAQMAML